MKNSRNKPVKLTHTAAVINAIAADGLVGDSSSRLIPPGLVMKPRSIPKILLIDDDPVFCKIMGRAADYLNAPLTSVHAMEQVDHNSLSQFDVLVVDYSLDGVTGLEIARRLDRRFAVPIILVSQNWMVPDKRWSKSIHDFVSKDSGPYAIFDAAFEAFEIGMIHHDMLKKKNLTH